MHNKLQIFNLKQALSTIGRILGPIKVCTFTWTMNQKDFRTLRFIKTTRHLVNHNVIAEVKYSFKNVAVNQFGLKSTKKVNNHCKQVQHVIHF